IFSPALDDSRDQPSERGIARGIAYLPLREGFHDPGDMDRLLTAEEAADRLGVRTEWVWAQARAGRIPHVRLGRYRRFRESALEAWLLDLETGGPARSTSLQPRAIPLRRRA